MKQLLMLALFFTIGQSQVIRTVDTVAVWKNGFNACFNIMIKDTSVVEAFDAGVYAGKIIQLETPMIKKKYVYFSTTANDDTLTAWIQRGYRILYFGTKSATTGKTTVRGMKP